MVPFSDEGRSKVYRANFEGKAVAVKVFYDRKESLENSDYDVRDIDLFKNEIENLKILNHPNIVKLYAFAHEDVYQAIVLELMPNKSFMHYLKTHYHDTRDKNLCERIALDVSKGLVYLHGLRLVHLDIKADNILLDDQLNGKICDFESAELLHPGEDYVIVGGRGTARWSAPERYRGSTVKYTQAYDIYPLGWLLFLGQIEEGFTPYGEKYSTNQVKNFHETGKLPDISDTISPDIKSLILHCLQFKPADRPSALEVQETLKRRIKS